MSSQSIWQQLTQFISPNAGNFIFLNTNLSLCVVSMNKPEQAHLPERFDLSTSSQFVRPDTWLTEVAFKGGNPAEQLNILGRAVLMDR